MNLLTANKCRELIAELAPVITDALKPLGWLPPLFESDDSISRPPFAPVFVGGAIIPLLITDPAARQATATKDVDIVVEVISSGDYFHITDQLRKVGFQHQMDKPIEALFWNDIRVDVLPSSEAARIPTNQWFEHVLHDAKRESLNNNIIAWLASAPSFLATKFEAFHRRGNVDYLNDKDLSDIIDVVDGRSELIEELPFAEMEVARFLATQAQWLIENNHFHEALPNLMGDDRGREKIVIARLRAIAAFGKNC